MRTGFMKGGCIYFQFKGFALNRFIAMECVLSAFLVLLLISTVLPSVGLAAESAESKLDVVLIDEAAVTSNAMLPKSSFSPTKSSFISTERKAYSPFVDEHLGNAVLGLAFVTGLVLVSAWLVKRTNLVRYGQGQQLKVLSSFPVSNKEKVILVQVNGVELLLGVTTQNIRTLHTFPVKHTPVDHKSSAVNASSESTYTDQSASSGISDLMGKSKMAGSFSEKLKEMVERGRVT